MTAQCESCIYYEYYEQFNDCGCTASLDEDDALRLLMGTMRNCPYYTAGDEYSIVKKQN